MAQNKTTLILNNLVVLNYPLRTSTLLQVNSDETECQEIVVQLPFLALLQKVDFVDSSSKTKQFPKILQVQRQSISDESWQDVIDFKKQKINWRFKSRMRSNSNEFIEGFPFNNQSNTKEHKHNDQTKSRPGNESFSCNSSLNMLDEDDWDEEVKGTLVCGCSNTFKLILSLDDFQQDSNDKVCLQLSVWPTIRMPTGNSTIPLINTSFLFASRNHIEESFEIDLLVAQSLVNGRKFIQASEKIRSIESRLLKQGTRDDLYRVMLLEIIIGESMSQHSYVSEKIFAFKRATLIHSWLSLNTDDVPQLLTALSQLQKEHVKQEEAPQKLFSIKQRLVAILIANIGSHIEVVRMAVLKTLEYLLDTLNCSLENQIVDILKVVCFCYPTQCEESHAQKQIRGFFQFDFTNQPEINQQLPFFSWYLIHNETDCQVQDVKTLSHSYVQSALNCYNHILENMGIVLASASHNLLAQVFKSIILPQALNPKLPQELRIYLLKYADQILHICKGDINFPGTFLSEIIEIIVEQPHTSQTKMKKRLRVQSAATQAVAPHFSNLQQVCLNLLETMKVKYFTTLSLQTIHSSQQNHNNAAKGHKTFEWLVNHLNELAVQLERHTQNQSKPQSLQEQRKLNILIGIVECVVQSIIDEEQGASQVLKFGLQSMYCRNEDQKPIEEETKSFNFSAKKTEQRPLQQKMNQNLKVLQVFLPLTQPLITLLNFSVASQERLSLFKQVWQLLTQILARLPVKLTKMPQLTIGSLIQPHLERLNQFMQTSSPSKYLLEFLQIVLLSIEPPLENIESTLLPTLLHTIPHNLHDEVFQVTSLMLDIYSSQISAENISLLVAVLVHKYTMRSKEHKMLVDKVVSLILLGQESKVLFDCFVDQCLISNHLHSESTHDDESVFFEKLGLLQEFVHQMTEMHVWHFRRLLSRSKQAFERVFSINPRSKHFMVKLLLKLSEFYMKNCAPYNYYEYPIVQQASQMNQNQVNRTSSLQRGPFINQLQGINNPGFGHGNVYSEPSVELFSIGHHDDDLYFSGGLDHPRVEMDPQVAAYLEDQPRNRVKAHYQSQHVDYRPQTLMNREINEGEDMRQQSELYESPRQAALPHNTTSVICDQVSLIDRDRLLLIQIHSTLIRQVIEGSNHQESQQHFGLQETGQASDAFQDANIKLCVVNLMQNLFGNLLPTPSLKNMAVQDIIGQDRVNLVQPVRMQQVQEAGLEIQSEPAENNQSLQESEATIPAENQPGAMQHTQSNAHLEIIPDFAEIVIQGQVTNSLHMEPTFPEEFECSDTKYLCARVVAFLKIAKYIENIITTTSWANLKSLAICVLNLGCHIPNVNILPSKLQRHLKNALQSLIIKLVQNNRDSESKASALNTLASMCNLQLKQKSKFFAEGAQPDNEPDSPKYLQQNDQNTFNLDESLSEDIQISKHLDLFRVNSAFVSVAIWQEVFDLQDDQNYVVREASTALVQLCAPRESVTHFCQIKREQYKLKVNQLLQTSLSASTQPYLGANGSQMEQTTSGGITTNNNFTSTIKSQKIAINAYGCEEGSEQSSDHTSQRSSFFGLQNTSEEDVRATLSIFNLRLSPVLTLQADRTSQREPTDQYLKRMTFQDLAEDRFMIDERLNLQRPTFSKAARSQQNSEVWDEDDELHSESSSDEIYIFRRQDSGRSNFRGESAQVQQPDSWNQGNLKIHSSALQTQQRIQALQQENEDLGIIDLDDSEFNQDDDFEELDDDKLPVLKNTYSKKNRPNNSKSVAIGSRSQGGTLKQLGLRDYNQTNSASNLNQDLEDRRYLKTKFAAAAEFIKMDRIEELKSEFDKSSRMVVRRGNGDSESNQDLEYELSFRDGVSVASLPVANRRQIQSAGGKRSQKANTSRKSSNANFHVLSQGETFLLPSDLKNLDIEEVQIFVRRKQRPASSRGAKSVYSYNSQTERALKSLGSQYFMAESLDQLSRDNKLIQTEEESKKTQTPKPVQENPTEPAQSRPATVLSATNLLKKKAKPNSSHNIVPTPIVRVIQKVNRPESTLQKQKQIVTKSSVKKPTTQAVKASEQVELKATTSLTKVKRTEISIVAEPETQQLFKKKSSGKGTPTPILDEEKLIVIDIL